MADTHPVDTSDATPEIERRPLWQRILKWIGVAILALVFLVVAIVVGINTDPGRRFVADQIGGYTTASGLNIRVGRIDGSLYGRMRLSNVRVSDPRGVFLTSPRLDVDWRPFKFVNNHVDVRSASAQLITLRRNPELKSSTEPTDPNAPILPDLDIDIGSLQVARFVMEPPVSGARHIARLAGEAHIADRRAQLNVDAVALRAPGVAGGDRARVRLDAVPDDNKLDLDVRVQAPANGVVAQLAGLKAPLTATISGQGSWANWQGRALATLGGGQLANLSVVARDGHIEVRGPTRPGLYLEGPVERLTAPQMQVALDVTLEKRSADTRLTLNSDALAVDAGGIIDLANSRFGNFAVDAMLKTPGAIAPNLRGRNVLARVVLNGAFATPVVDYKIRAAALGFADTSVENLYAEGQARVNSDRILVPVHARAKRIAGLNPALGGLTTNVRVDGDIAITMPNILSDNLRIRSDTIDATAIIAANVQTGRYTGALQGRVNNFRVDSVGILNIQTNANLVPGPRGGFGITGRVAVQTKQLFNSGVRDFLGGNAVLSTRFGYSPEGVVTFQSLRMNAPQFRITRGEGRFDPGSGGLLVNADAYSTQYGPLFARVTGSATAPVVRLRAPRPGVGVGLADVDARIVGRGGAYQVNATGGTTYGPFTADVLVRPGAQLAIDIRRVLFAGVQFAGRVVQTAAGPFAGRINFSGSGLTGVAALGAEGRYQRASINARASAATIPGAVDFTIGRAIITADAVLYDQPKIVADAQVADMRYGATVIQTGRIKVNYAGGSGTAQGLFTGSNSVPFRLAVNSRLSPNLYLVALRGQANNVDFRTPQAARIVPQAGGGYRLEPTRLDFDRGTMRLAGRFGGSTTEAQARLDRLDLSLLNALVPNLGVGGQATGSVDYVQRTGQAMPQADMRLNIANFTRSSLASVSEPIDIAMQGRLTDANGDLRALFRRNDMPVGRVVATLTPSGNGSWTTRLMQGPLSGGIRYNGPSGVLFSLAGLAQQQLSGPIAVAADFGGTVSAPRINGLIRADNLTYENETYGTRLTDMRIGARFNNDRLDLTQMQARAGQGTVQAQGTVSLAAAQGFPMDVRVAMRNAQLARSDALGATASGDIRIQKNADGGLISGTVTVPNARYQIIRQGAAEVPELSGVRKKSAVRQPRPTDRPTAEPVGLFKLDLRVRADNQLFVSGMGLESEWQMDMRIGGTSAAPVITGGLDVVRGTYSFAGKRFELQRGQVRFRGGALTDPDINILATTTNDNVTFNIAITGTGQRPQIAFTSTPSLPQDEVVSRLLFGTNPENLSATEAIQLAAALNSLRGSGGGLNPLGKLRSATGFDRLRVLGADEASGRGTSLAAGKYLTDDIYIEIVTDARGFTATQLTIALTRAISVLSQAGSFGGSNVQLRYSRDF
jgi:translocation and assembly module TamB